jgi:hypothetical protein
MYETRIFKYRAGRKLFATVIKETEMDFVGESNAFRGEKSATG